MEREREKYIALGRGRESMDMMIELSRLISEDSGLVQCFDHALFFNHAVFFLGLVQCFDHGVFVMDLARWG